MRRSDQWSWHSQPEIPHKQSAVQVHGLKLWYSTFCILALFVSRTQLLNLYLARRLQCKILVWERKSAQWLSDTESEGEWASTTTTTQRLIWSKGGDCTVVTSPEHSFKKAQFINCISPWIEHFETFTVVIKHLDLQIITKWNLIFYNMEP